MGSLLYLLGIGLAGIAGIRGLEIYFIPFSSAILVIGFVLKLKEKNLYSSWLAGLGPSALPKALFTNLIYFSVITSIIYFVGYLFS